MKFQSIAQHCEPIVILNPTVEEQQNRVRTEKRHKFPKPHWVLPNKWKVENKIEP